MHWEIVPHKKLGNRSHTWHTDGFVHNLFNEIFLQLELVSKEENIYGVT